MTFSMKNTGLTYQRAINVIFYDLISTFLECYIDAIIVKLEIIEEQLLHLRKALIG